MTSLARRLARPELLALPPLDMPAPHDRADLIKLDANESGYPPLLDGPLAERINRYPEPQPRALRATMAALYGVAPEQLVITRGADDAIDLLVRAFCRPAIDAVAITPPTFAAYAESAVLQGARLLECSLDDDFGFDADAFLGETAADPSLKLVFLCSPNNPTGAVIDPATVLRVAHALPDTIVVLDEAYIEFADVESVASAAAIRPNLVVLRTLSKAWGLAGARIGCAIGDRSIVSLLERLLPAYPLASLSIEQRDDGAIANRTADPRAS